MGPAIVVISEFGDSLVVKANRMRHQLRIASF